MVITINLPDELACVAKIMGGGDLSKKLDGSLLEGIYISEGIQIALEDNVEGYREELRCEEEKN